MPKIGRKKIRYFYESSRDRSWKLNFSVNQGTWVPFVNCRISNIMSISIITITSSKFHYLALIASYRFEVHLLLVIVNLVVSEYKSQNVKIGDIV